jgi:hypothetical protein
MFPSGKLLRASLKVHKGFQMTPSAFHTSIGMNTKGWWKQKTIKALEINKAIHGLNPKDDAPFIIVDMRDKKESNCLELPSKNQVNEFGIGYLYLK